MSGPWEKYSASEPQSGPWSKFQPQAGGETAVTPRQAPEYQVPDGHVLHETDRGRFIETPQGQWMPLEVDGQVNELAQRALEKSPDDLERAVALSDRAQRIDAGGDTSGGFAGNFLRGTPFVGSYTDEALGGVAGVLRGEGAAAGAQRSRDITDAYAIAKPGMATAANLSGAVTGSLPLAAAAAPRIAAAMPATRGGQALMGLGLGGVAGATEGAIYGSGQTGQEGGSDTRRGNAITGGAVGAGIGSVTGVAAPYVAAGGRAIAQRALQAIRGSDTGVIARELGVSREAATVIRNAIDSGDDSAALAAIQRGGDSAMLADATAGTRSLVDTAAQAPGGAGTVARQAVGERVSAATRQMNAALDDALGVPTGRNELTRDIMTSSSGPRQQAYDAAYASPIDYSTGAGRRIEATLSRVDPSVMRQAVDEANAQMRDLGVTNQQIRATIGENGEIAFDNMPDVRQLDALKQSLDSIAENSKNAQGIMSPQGRRAASQASALRGAIGDAVPAYNEAVELGGQAIAERNAVDLGTKLLTGRVTREEATDAIRGMSAAEMTAARQGVRTFIDDTTANIARTVTDNGVEAREGIRILRDFSSRANKEKLTRLLGRPEANRLLDQIDEAATGFELRAAIAENSKTAARNMTDQAVRDQTQGGALRTMMRSEPVNATKQIVQSITGETDEAQTLRQMGLYREISEALVNTRGGRARRALAIMEDASRGQQITDRQAAFVAQTLVAGASGSVPVANREVANTLSIR